MSNIRKGMSRLRSTSRSTSVELKLFLSSTTRKKKAETVVSETTGELLTKGSIQYLPKGTRLTLYLGTGSTVFLGRFKRWRDSP